MLVHKSGNVIASEPYRLVVRQGGKKQDEGAEITYSRRYSMASFFGIASDDDTDAQTMEEFAGERKSQPTNYPRNNQNGNQRPPQGAPKQNKQNASLPEDLSNKLNEEIKRAKQLTGMTVKEVVAEVENRSGIKMQDVTVETAQTIFDVLDELMNEDVPF